MPGCGVTFAGEERPAAKAAVHNIIEAIGFFPVGPGALDGGGPLASLPSGALAPHSFIKLWRSEEAKAP